MFLSHTRQLLSESCVSNIFFMVKARKNNLQLAAIRDRTGPICGNGAVHFVADVLGTSRELWNPFLLSEARNAINKRKLHCGMRIPIEK